MSNQVATGKQQVGKQGAAKNNASAFSRRFGQSYSGKPGGSVPSTYNPHKKTKRKTPRNSHNSQSNKGFKNDLRNKKRKSNLPKQFKKQTKPKGFDGGKPKKKSGKRKLSPLNESKQLSPQQPTTQPKPKAQPKGFKPAPKSVPKPRNVRPPSPKVSKHPGVPRSSLQRIPWEWVPDILDAFFPSDRKKREPPESKIYKKKPFKGVDGQRYIYTVQGSGGYDFSGIPPQDWPNWGGPLYGEISEFFYWVGTINPAKQPSSQYPNGFPATVQWYFTIIHNHPLNSKQSLSPGWVVTDGATEADALAVEPELWVYPVDAPQIETYNPDDFPPRLNLVPPPPAFIPPVSPPVLPTPFFPSRLPTQPPAKPPYHPPYTTPPKQPQPEPEPELEPGDTPQPISPPWSPPFPSEPGAPQVEPTEPGVTPQQPGTTPSTPEIPGNQPSSKPGLTPGNNPSNKGKYRRGNEFQEQLQGRGLPSFQDPLLQQMPIIPSPNPPPVNLPTPFKPRSPQSLLPPPTTCKCVGGAQGEQQPQGEDELRHVNITIPKVEQFLNPLTLKWEARKSTEQVQVLQSKTGSDAGRVRAAAERQVIIAEAVIRAKNLPRNLGIIALWQKLNFLMNVHNAMHLSVSLKQTIGDLLSLGLDVVGIENDDGSPIDVNGLVDEGIDQFLEDRLGEERWSDTKSWFASANKIYQAGSNIISSVQGMFDSLRSILEFTSNNTGKIGNALKKAGSVFENAYEWMSENARVPQGRQNKLDRIIDGIDNVDNAASSLTAVTSEVKSIQDEVDEMKELRKEFTEAMASVPPGNPLENTPVKDTAAEEKSAVTIPDGDFELGRAE